MLYSDLSELKKVLDIPVNSTAEDAKLAFFLEYATNLIEEVLNRPDLSKKLRTEYYNGTGTQKLSLKYRPVFTTPTILVYKDYNGFFGSTPNAFDPSTTALVYGTDFCLNIDQPDGTSRSGTLIRMNDLWTEPFVRQEGYLSPFMGTNYGSIKVIYTAGYTVDSLPPAIRAACELIVAKLRYLFPLGVELTSESYEDRHILLNTRYKDYFFGLIKPILWGYRSWKF